MEICRLWMIFGVSLLAIDGHSGLTITGCEQGSVEVVEGTSPSFSTSYYCNQWMVYDRYGQTLCYDAGQTSSSSNCPASCLLVCLYDLKIKEITRDSARMIVCNNYGVTATCSLKIVAPPVYENGSCSVSISNWTITGSCNVIGMYSSNNTYTCRWREKNEEFGGWQVLYDYTANNTRIYTRGICSFTRPIPFLNGSYTFIMKVLPGSDAYYNNTIVIDPPDQVQLNHNCPSYVFEGSSVSCTCNASRTGSPPGLVAWYGMSNAILLLPNVSQNMSGEQFTCRLEWGSKEVIKKMTSYTLTVAYGPSDVSINRIAETTDDKLGIIRFICSAIYFYPSVLFQWNTTCENRTDYTHFSVCSINVTKGTDHMVIECTATNTYFPQASFSRIYVWSIEERGQEIKDSSAECVNIVIVGGAGAAVIALVFIAAVLAVCIIKRQRGMAERKGTPLSQLVAIFKRPKSQTLTDRQSASLEDIFSITGSSTAGHGVDNVAVSETTQSSINRYVTYDNNYVTQETGGRTTAMKPLTKPMPATAGKQNSKDLSDSFYDIGCKPADIEHDYEDFSPTGYKASQSSDASCTKVATRYDDENLYENVTTKY